LRPVNKLILGSNRSMSNGLGSNRPGSVDAGLGQGMEMALTVVLFLGIGWLVDSWVDTRPIFTLTFVIFAVVGQMVRMWFEYDARMKSLETERLEKARGSRATASASVPPENAVPVPPENLPTPNDGADR
jgi:Flp pilus assembly protein TadB